MFNVLSLRRLFSLPCQERATVPLLSWRFLAFLPRTNFPYFYNSLKFINLVLRPVPQCPQHLCECLMPCRYCTITSFFAVYLHTHVYVYPCTPHSYNKKPNNYLPQIFVSSIIGLSQSVEPSTHTGVFKLVLYKRDVSDSVTFTSCRDWR